MAHANQTQEALTYFNLHTSGIGYLNRVREVPVHRGPPFMACDIAALHGASDAVEYTRFDCKVAGGEAERLIRQYWDAVQADKKVLLSFRIGDLWVDPFLYEKGDRQGQPGASLKGRLLFIEWIKVDGQLLYKAPARQQATAPVEQAPSNEPAEESADTGTDKAETTTDAPTAPDAQPSAPTVNRDTERTVQPA
ncbi:STY4534 family ICE replication protein [Pseudomonas sp. GD03721]|nr:MULTISPECIES: STY4534 family ICE replication protein [unclassified Pseudomonas]MDH1440365.1 STY4534 family ICE replication protein [Pseudomonas sp. GD03722]WGG03545.1 STY4534 family ICE replication protein [Pseudomonas sp. GD03721]WGG07713.1 STY4534 family ICE replication protein [Pseudomonas sp. GD03919]